jgi:hypothetical protein
LHGTRRAGPSVLVLIVTAAQADRFEALAGDHR